MRLHQSTTTIALVASMATLALADYQGKLELDNTGCSIGADDTSNGFSANFYSYPYDSNTYTDPAFYNGGAYSANGLIGSADLISDPDFTQLNNYPTEHTSDLHGVEVPVTNFVMELFGYFKADVTGIYTFRMNKIDEAAMVWMASSGWDCCNPQMKQFGNPNEAVLFASKALGTSNVQQSYVFLEAGFYYPIKLVYVNAISDGLLDFSIVSPNGNELPASSYVYQIHGDLKGSDVCSSTKVSTSYGSTTYYATTMIPHLTQMGPVYTTGDDGETTLVGVTIGVDISEDSTLTSTSFWDQSTTSATTFVTAKDSNGQFVAFNQIITYIPAYDTITSTWTNNFGAISTIPTTITDSNGKEIESSIVITYAQPLQTSYIEADQQTYETITSTKDLGWTQTTFIAIIGPSLSRTTIFGNSPQTQSITSLTEIVDEEGVKTTSRYIQVALPALQTSISFGPTPTTFTTIWTTTIDGSTQVTGVIINEKIPEITVYNEGSNDWIETSTSTGIITTDANGIEGTYNVVHIYRKLQTSFEFDDNHNAYTTTTLVDGTKTFVEVEGPEPLTYTTIQINTWQTATSYSSIEGGYIGIVLLPSFSHSAVQWNKKYTSQSTITTRFHDWEPTTHIVVDYVPSYYQSVSYWEKPYATTITSTSLYTNELGIFTSTLLQVFAPPIPTATYTWEKPYGTTFTTFGTMALEDGTHQTATHIVVELPGENPINSWTTITSFTDDCNFEATSTTTEVVTENGVETTVGYEYVTTGSSSCYYPEETLSTSTTSTSECAITTATTTVTTDVTDDEGVVSTTTYVLVVLPNTDVSCTPLSTSTTSTTECAITTATTTVTTDVTDDEGVVSPTTYVLVVLPNTDVTCTPLATSTTSTSECAITTATTTVTTDVTDDEGVVSPTTYVLVVLPNTDVTCTPLSTVTSATTITSNVLNCGAQPSTTTSTTLITGETAVTNAQYVVVEAPSSDCASGIAPTMFYVTLSSFNSACETSTISIFDMAVTISNEAVTTKGIALAVPPLSCYSAVTYVTENGCGSSTYTTLQQTTLPNGVISSVAAVVQETPAPMCFTSAEGIFTTTEAADGCEGSVYTTHIATVDSFGKYVNATLVVIETPTVPCIIPTLTTSIPATACEGSLFTTSVVTVDNQGFTITAPLVVVGVPTAACTTSTFEQSILPDHLTKVNSECKSESYTSVTTFVDEQGNFVTAGVLIELIPDATCFTATSTTSSSLPVPIVPTTRSSTASNTPASSSTASVSLTASTSSSSTEQSILPDHLTKVNSQCKSESYTSVTTFVDEQGNFVTAGVLIELLPDSTCFTTTSASTPTESSSLSSSSSTIATTSATVSDSSSSIGATSHSKHTVTEHGTVTSTILCTKCSHTTYTAEFTTVTNGVTVTTTVCIEETPVPEQSLSPTEGEVQTPGQPGKPGKPGQPGQPEQKTSTPTTIVTKTSSESKVNPTGTPVATPGTPTPNVPKPDTNTNQPVKETDTASPSNGAHTSSSVVVPPQQTGVTFTYDGSANMLGSGFVTVAAFLVAFVF